MDNKMKKFLALINIVLVVCCLNHMASSQSNETSGGGELKKFEVGGHFTIMFQDDFDPKNPVFKQFGFRESITVNRRYESGFGGRFTFNINRALAVEGEINFTPSIATLNERSRNGQSTNIFPPGGKKTQFLAGVKYGIRREKWGIFAKARPGAIRFSAYPTIVGRFVVPSPTGGQPLDVLLFEQEFPATFFNLDVGGVFEYYPSRKTVFRVDVGDTIIRYGAQKPKNINPTFTRHNFQTSVGFGFRF